MSIIFKLIAKFPNITDIGSMETKKIFHKRTFDFTPHYGLKIWKNMEEMLF